MESSFIVFGPPGNIQLTTPERNFPAQRRACLPVSPCDCILVAGGRIQDFVNLRAKYLVTVVVLAASFVGAFVPGGRCLRSVFGAAQPASRHVLTAPDSGKAPGPLQVPACLRDAHSLIASVSESTVTPIQHDAVALREAPDRRPAAVLPARTVPTLSDSSQGIPISRTPSVLRI